MKSLFFILVGGILLVLSSSFSFALTFDLTGPDAQALDGEVEGIIVAQDRTVGLQAGLVTPDDARHFLLGGGNAILAFVPPGDSRFPSGGLGISSDQDQTSGLIANEAIRVEFDPDFMLESVVIATQGVTGVRVLTEPRPGMAVSSTGVDLVTIGFAPGVTAFTLSLEGLEGALLLVSIRGTVPGVRVEIDIKPGSSPNSINPKSHGVIPVAILTTETFDATTVDPLSVEFGPGGATEAHGQGHIEDVNQDGEPDLVLHFKTQATGIECGDTSASLTGKTFDGDPIQGSDAIRTVGCKK